MRFTNGLVVIVGLTGAMVGCNKPPQRLNAPPQGHSNYPNRMQDTFVHMVDNAMLEDLSLADIHFVPHSVELNGTGARRLERYSKLLTVYGGSIQYATSQANDPLAEGRMASIRTYLATTGIASERIKVTQGLPGGVGLTAREAIANKSTNLPSAAKGAGAAAGVQKPTIAALSAVPTGGR